MTRRRLGALGLCGAGAGLLSGCGSDAALDGLASGGVGRATSAPTGDALGLEDDRLVKLAGVEAPKGQADGAEASRDALAALALGRKVSLLFAGPHQDAFGRTVAQVRRADDRLWLEGALLDAGAARVRTTAAGRALARAMLEREAVARQGKRGLWALEAYQVRLPTEIDPRDGGFQIVEGRVARAGETRGLAYLDFFESWHDALSVEIPSLALKDFRSAGVDPLRLQGRLIRVRGEVQGLRMTVDHPEAVELLRG